MFPIKGGSNAGRPLVERPSIHNRYRVPLFVLCVDTGKDLVFSRLRIASAGPGFVHLPDWVDEEYLAQLTAEKMIRKAGARSATGSSSASEMRRWTSRSMHSRRCTSSGRRSSAVSERKPLGLLSRGWRFLSRNLHSPSPLLLPSCNRSRDAPAG